MYIRPKFSHGRHNYTSELPNIFSKKRAHKAKETEELTAQLDQQIGQLKVELDWVNKKSGDFS